MLPQVAQQFVHEARMLPEHACGIGNATECGPEFGLLRLQALAPVCDVVAQEG